MPTATPKYLPQGERLLEGTITSGELSAVATTCDVSNPPAATKLPTYFEFEPDSVDKKETVRVTDVSGSTITFERGVYNGGTGQTHASNSAYKQKVTSEHWKKVVEAIEDGFLMEDDSLVLTRDSATQFTITGIDHTAFYTEGRILRFNESDSNIGLVTSSSLSGSDTVVTIGSADSIPTPLNSVEIGIQPKASADRTVTKTGTQTLTNKTLTSAVLNTGVSGTAIDTDPTLAADSDTLIAPQKAIKAYVGNQTTVASSATPTPTGDRKRNELYITALAEASEFQVPSGTPANGNILIIRVKDNGTARALTYNAIYDGLFDTLPSTTTLGKYLYIGFVYNSTTSKWEMLAYQNEA